MSATVTQYGFFFDQSRCTGCRACVIACKDWNDLPPGPVKWLRLYEYEKGTFPSVRLNYQFVPCYHCENPVCVTAAKGAMYKEEKYGVVLIDPNQATGANLRAAWEACPYGSIAFDSDAPNASASKCTMCIDRLEQGLKPICVLACPMRALEFGVLSDLQKKYGTNRDLEDLPSSATAKPAVVFKPHAPKKQLVPYDTSKGLTLLAKRDPLPPLYATPSDVTDIPTNLMHRNSLDIKPKSTEELMQQTQDDNA